MDARWVPALALLQFTRPQCHTKIIVEQAENLCNNYITIIISLQPYRA